MSPLAADALQGRGRGPSNRESSSLRNAPRPGLPLIRVGALCCLPCPPPPCRHPRGCRKLTTRSRRAAQQHPKISYPEASQRPRPDDWILITQRVVGPLRAGPTLPPGSSEDIPVLSRG